MTRRLSPRVLVLCYHRVAETELDPWCLAVSPSRFDEQLAVLRSAYDVIPAAAAGTRRPGGRDCVAVTFDDGYADMLHNAFPLLRRHGVPATVFVVSDAIGDPRGLWWDELTATMHAAGHEVDSILKQWATLRQAEPDARRRELERLREEVRTYPVQVPAVLTADELATLAHQDEITIGAHTRSHPTLAKLGAAVQRAEVEGSKRALETLLGERVLMFAYPHGAPGDYTRETIELVRSAGFSRAFTTGGMRVSRSVDPLETPRLMVGDLNGDAFARLLARAFGR